THNLTLFTSKHLIKFNIYGRSISEIEAFNGFCYQILLGDRHPDVASAYDEHGDRIGVTSRLIPDFQSIHNYVKNHNVINTDTLLNKKIIDIWVAAYVEEETDLHFNNYGFNQKGEFVKIDNDRSTWALTSKYIKIHPKTGR